MSDVTFNEFAERFSDELQVDINIALNTTLSDINEYDSMGKINASLLIEELFNFQIDFEDLNSIDTLKMLYDFCSAEKAP